jgi:hypothetical protein
MDGWMDGWMDGLRICGIFHCPHSFVPTASKNPKFIFFSFKCPKL